MKRIALILAVFTAIVATSLASLFLTTGAIRQHSASPTPKIERPPVTRTQISGSPENQAWQHIAAARSTGDAKHYKSAMAIARRLEDTEDTRFSGNLLRGHLLHQQHRFSEALDVARRLADGRGMHCDYGLLGDVLFDTGEVAGAIDAYSIQLPLPAPASSSWEKIYCRGKVCLPGRKSILFSPSMRTVTEI